MTLPPKAILKKRNLRPKKALGQNFLQDESAAYKIVAAADIKPDDRVVEIGPGLGALTFPLTATGARITVIEADRAMAAALKERLGKKYQDQVDIVLMDALKFDLTDLGPGLIVIGNLPYQITSPFVFKLLASPNIDRAVLTIQKEVADRLMSPPGPKAYGQMSVLVQLKAKVEQVLSLPPGAFYPAPKVASTTIRMTFGQPPPLPLDDYDRFVKVVKASFAQRRKTLRKALLGSPLGLDQEHLAAALETAGIEPTIRAERLSVADFIRLANALGD